MLGAVKAKAHGWRGHKGRAKSRFERVLTAGRRHGVRRLRRGVIYVGVLAFAVDGCSSGSDVGGGTLHVAGCRTQLAVGDHMTMRAQWTAPKSAKYTYVLLDQGNFTKNSLFDETLNSAADVPISNEWALPGPRAGQTKTIVAELTANKAGNSTLMLQIWGSDDTTSAPPTNAQVASCDVAINP